MLPAGGVVQPGGTANRRVSYAELAMGMLTFRRLTVNPRRWGQVLHYDSFWDFGSRIVHYSTVSHPVRRGPGR